jgi:hypothetical protein
MSKIIQSLLANVLLFSFTGLVNYQPTQAQIEISQPIRVASASTKYQVFDSSNSPNKRYAIAWGISGRTSSSPRLDENDDFEKIENYLVDTKTNKIITKLKYSKTFPNQNHGGITSVWTPDSKLVLIINEGKWQPQNVSLVNVNAIQINVFDQLVKDTRTFLSKNDGAVFQKSRTQLVYNLDTSQKSFKLTNNRLQIPVNIYIPKAENGYESNVLLTYQVETNGNLKLSLVNAKKFKPIS